MVATIHVREVTAVNRRAFRAGCWCAWALSWALASATLAGPPLVTDDPGVVGRGSWEVITAFTAERLSSGERSHSAELDVSYGLTRRSQLSFALPHRRVGPAGEPRSGFGSASAGYKWQFLANPRWQMAIAANYSTPASSHFDGTDGESEASAFGVPLLVAYEWGPRLLQAQLGWAIDSRGERSWDYGLAVSQPLRHDTLWMLEIFGTASSSVDEYALSYQLGIDCELTAGLHLLAAAGQGIRSWSRPAHDLEFRFYLGLQWFRP